MLENTRRMAGTTATETTRARPPRRATRSASDPPASTVRRGSRRSTRTRSATPGTVGGGRGAATKRRRTLALVIAAVIVLVGIGASISPYRDYRQTQARLAAKEQQVATLQSQTDELANQAHRLQSDAYVEALARKELNLGRPGEEVFVVKNLPETTPASSAQEAPRQAGPLERLVTAIRGLF